MLGESSADPKSTWNVPFQMSPPLNHCITQDSRFLSENCPCAYGRQLATLQPAPHESGTLLSQALVS